MQKKQGRAAPAWKQAASLILTDLEQIRVLAAPLRVRILENLCAEEHTTKQIAERLGEKPTRLYHHVEALERVGLVRLTRTRQVRGTVERYFKAVARSFRTDADLFRTEGDDAKAETLARMATTVLRNTSEDLLQLLRSGHDVLSSEQGVLGYIEVRASDKEIEALRRKLMKLVKDLEGKRGAGLPRDGRRYRLTLAYFPLDLT